MTDEGSSILTDRSEVSNSRLSDIPGFSLPSHERTSKGTRYGGRAGYVGAGASREASAYETRPVGKKVIDPGHSGRGERTYEGDRPRGKRTHTSGGWDDGASVGSSKIGLFKNYDMREQHEKPPNRYHTDIHDYSEGSPPKLHQQHSEQKKEKYHPSRSNLENTHYGRAGEDDLGQRAHPERASPHARKGLGGEGDGGSPHSENGHRERADHDDPSRKHSPGKQQQKVKKGAKEREYEEVLDKVARACWEEVGHNRSATGWGRIRAAFDTANLGEMSEEEFKKSLSRLPVRKRGIVGQVKEEELLSKREKEVLVAGLKRHSDDLHAPPASPHTYSQRAAAREERHGGGTGTMHDLYKNDGGMWDNPDKVIPGVNRGYQGAEHFAGDPRPEGSPLAGSVGRRSGTGADQEEFAPPHRGGQGALCGDTFIRALRTTEFMDRNLTKKAKMSSGTGVRSRAFNDAARRIATPVSFDDPNVKTKAGVERQFNDLLAKAVERDVEDPRTGEVTTKRFVSENQVRQALQRRDVRIPESDLKSFTQGIRGPCEGVPQGDDPVLDADEFVGAFQGVSQGLPTVVHKGATPLNRTVAERGWESSQARQADFMDAYERSARRSQHDMDEMGWPYQERMMVLPDGSGTQFPSKDAECGLSQRQRRLKQEAVERSRMVKAGNMAQLHKKLVIGLNCHDSRAGRVSGLTRHFINADDNHDGTLSKGEFIQSLEHKSDMRKEELGQLFNFYDRNDDGKVDINEFVEQLQYNMHGKSPYELDPEIHRGLEREEIERTNRAAESPLTGPRHLPGEPHFKAPRYESSYEERMQQPRGYKIDTLAKQREAERMLVGDPDNEHLRAKADRLTDGGAGLPLRRSESAGHLLRPGHQPKRGGYGTPSSCQHGSPHHGGSTSERGAEAEAEYRAALEAGSPLGEEVQYHQRGNQRHWGAEGGSGVVTRTLGQEEAESRLIEQRRLGHSIARPGFAPRQPFRSAHEALSWEDDREVGVYEGSVARDARGFRLSEQPLLSDSCSSQGGLSSRGSSQSQGSGSSRGHRGQPMGQRVGHPGLLQEGAGARHHNPYAHAHREHMGAGGESPHPHHPLRRSSSEGSVQGSQHGSNLSAGRLAEHDGRLGGELSRSVQFRGEGDQSSASSSRSSRSSRRQPLPLGRS